MQSVVDKLYDPYWWFTAVVVSIVSGLAAGFLKDYCERKVGIFWAWNLRQKETRELVRQDTITKWSSSASFLAIALLGTLMDLVFLFGGASIAAFIIDWAILDAYKPGTPLSLPIVIELVALAIILILFVYLSFLMASRLSLVRACYKRFREINNLPPFFPFSNV